jgi:hypothetical protein
LHFSNALSLGKRRGSFLTLWSFEEPAFEIRTVSRLWWFTYCDHSGRLLGALILDSSNLTEARNRAVLEGTDHCARYCEGYELDRESAKLIPAGAIGRMLDRKQVHQLVRQLARGIANRTAAASVTRRGSVRTRRLH